MPVMTFVGKSFAKRGFKYYFEGIHASCPENCPLYATCQKNLVPNTLYEVSQVMEKTFPCPNDFHLENMQLVKMEEPKIKVSMFNKDVFEGSITSFAPVECDRVDCPYIDYCAPQSLLIKAGEKIKIIQKDKKIKDCPRKLHISLIKVEKRPEA